MCVREILSCLKYFMYTFNSSCKIIIWTIGQLEIF